MPVFSRSNRDVLPSRLVSDIRINCLASSTLRCVSSLLYGCETWSLTLRVERRLRVFENRVLRRVCGPKRDEVTGE
jgi:hypothetical protein